MKSLTITVHTDDQYELVKRLGSISVVSGYTLIHVEGHGRDFENDAFMASLDRALGVAPRIRADIVLSDAGVTEVIQSLKEAKASGDIQSAYYWVTAVEQEGHL